MFYTYVLKYDEATVISKDVIIDGHKLHVYYTDKDIEAFKKTVFYSSKKNITIIKKFEMDYNYSCYIYDIYNDTYKEFSNVQGIYYSIDNIIKKPNNIINNEFINKYIETAKHIPPEKFIRKLSEIREKINTIVSNIIASKWIYYVSFLGDLYTNSDEKPFDRKPFDGKPFDRKHFIDFTKYEHLMYSFSQILSGATFRNPDIIKHKDFKLKQLECIRFYKSNVQSLKDILDDMDMDLPYQTIDDISIIDSYLQKILEELYMMNIIAD